MTDNNPDINISLVDIREMPQSTVNNKAARRYRGERLNVQMRTALQPDNNNGTVSLSFAVRYVHDGAIVRTTLLDCGVIATFAIDDTDKVIDLDYGRGTLRIPHSLATLMLNIATGALRGMIAMRTAGTPLQAYPLPILNVAALAESISEPVTAAAV